MRERRYGVDRHYASKDADSRHAPSSRGRAHTMYKFFRLLQTGVSHMNKLPNRQYNVARADSLPVRVATMQRRRMFQDFLNVCAVAESDLVLDVGVTSDRTYESSNYLEAWLENKSRITAAGVDDASFLEDLYPGIQYCRADGLHLPFEDRSFDVVHSSAVLEHVGSYENQIKFIGECARVARRAFCITTPNRYFPIEFHTILPFIHWLPKAWFRSIMAATGRDFFASEENLNLMSKRDLTIAAALALESQNFNIEVRAVTLMGWPSNLMLYGMVNDAG